MWKETIGYKLKKREYVKAVNEIIDNDDWFDQISFINGSDSCNKLIAAGVLDLWFDPIYKEPEFEFGRWYKYKYNDSTLIFVESRERSYGFSNGEWYNNIAENYSNERYAIATDSEVEERLIAYAEKNYPIGTKFKSFNDGYKVREVKKYDSDTDVKYYNGDHKGKLAIRSAMYNKGLGLCSDPLVYVDGKWAEIIEEQREISMDEKINEIESILGDAINKLNALKSF